MLGIIRTQRSSKLSDEQQTFAHWFNRGTLVHLTHSSFYDYTATSVNPVFGHKLLQDRRDYRFSVIAQKINREDVLILPDVLKPVALKLAGYWLRIRQVAGR